MERSRFGKVTDRASIPRWLLLLPLAISFCGMQQQFWGWNWCDWNTKTCSETLSALSWSSVVFPHVLMFPLAMAPLRPEAIMAGLVAMDIGLWLLVLRTQPSQLSATRFGVLLTIWAALSAAVTLASPYLMVWTWHLIHGA